MIFPPKKTMAFYTKNSDWSIVGPFFLLHVGRGKFNVWLGERRAGFGLFFGGEGTQRGIVILALQLKRHDHFTHLPSRHGHN